MGWVWYSFATDENLYLVPLPIEHIGSLTVPINEIKEKCLELPAPKFESSLSTIN